MYAFGMGIVAGTPDNGGGCFSGAIPAYSSTPPISCPSGQYALQAIMGAGVDATDSKNWICGVPCSTYSNQSYLWAGVAVAALFLLPGTAKLLAVLPGFMWMRSSITAGGGI